MAQGEGLEAKTTKGQAELIDGPQFAKCGPAKGVRGYERSELQAERDEVFDDRQVLGDGAGEGDWCWVLGAWCEGSETEVEP